MSRFHNNNDAIAAVFADAKTVQQVAALPFVVIDGRVELLLITSRRRKRWVVPKGWPGRDDSLAEAAAREAEEEAGVVGPVRADPLGDYAYDKQMSTGYPVRCHVFVYPLLVLEHRVDWRERGARKLRWTAPGEAARLVDDRLLGQLIATLADDASAALHDFMREAA
ncbi:MAG: NUDIX hydrolase [Alphaproteobacteria bacterium]